MVERGLGATLALALLAVTGLGCAAGGAGGDTPGWARGEVEIEGASYEVAELAMELAFGADGYYSIQGNPDPNPGEDCVPGLWGGIYLYGPLPGNAGQAQDLRGKRLAVEFSGDGDDANLCFKGAGGLLGARDAWLRIDSVDGDRVEFTMSGSFDLYRERGGVPIVRTASARGSAQIVDIYQ